MDLRQLEYVVAVVDHGTFTRGAAAVHVSQPSLSQGIRALEQELGVELFHRVGRRAVLSAAGEAFLGPARLALRDSESARQAAGSVRGLTAGRLDIATLPTLAVEPLTAWVGEFRRRHPGVQVVVVEPDDTRALERLVRDGSCELALGERPAPHDLAVVPLGEQAIVAVVPDDAPLPAAGRVRLSRLARFPLVCTPVGTSTRDLVDAALAEVGATAEVGVQTTARDALIPLVAAGAGIAFLPRPVAEAARGHGVRIVATQPAIRREIGLLHRPGPLSPAGAAFLSIVAPA